MGKKWEISHKKKIMAMIGGVIGIACVILMSSRTLETKEMRERRLILDNKEPESFFKVLFVTLKQKNFLAYYLAYLLSQSCTQLTATSIPYR